MTKHQETLDKSGTVSNTVPESKRDFYYWLCENFSIKAANLWLDGYWQEFIDHVHEDY